MASHIGGRYFDDVEYQRRHGEVRARMSQRGLDACLIVSPENIYYLTGLDHMGYFACQLLIFPARGEPILVTRAMERATVRDQVPDVVHVGYTDGTIPPPVKKIEEATTVDAPWSMTVGAPTREYRGLPSPMPSAVVQQTVQALFDAGLANGVLAVDHSSNFLPHSIAQGVIEGTPGVTWEEIGSLVDDIRLVQSPAELELTRRAAAVSDAMMLSAIAAAGVGVNASEIMAAIYDPLFRRGAATHAKPRVYVYAETGAVLCLAALLARSVPLAAREANVDRCHRRQDGPGTAARADLTRSPFCAKGRGCRSTLLLPSRGGICRFIRPAAETYPLPSWTAALTRALH